MGDFELEGGAARARRWRRRRRRRGGDHDDDDAPLQEEEEEEEVESGSPEVPALRRTRHSGGGRVESKSPPARRPSRKRKKGEECEACGGDDDAHAFLLCDGCAKVHHFYCLPRPLIAKPRRKDVPEWYCASCSDAIHEEADGGAALRVGSEVRCVVDGSHRLAVVDSLKPGHALLHYRDYSATAPADGWVTSTGLVRSSAAARCGRSRARCN